MIDPKKLYRTRDGREVRIYAVDGGHGDIIHGAINDGGFWKPHAWHQNDFAFSGTGTSTFDLIEVRPRIQREVWVNVYPDEAVYGIAKDKKMCDWGKAKDRIACVKLVIDCEEGTGL